MKLSAPSPSGLSPSSAPTTERLPTGELGAALDRQRQQEDLAALLAAHAGTLDIERLVGRLPGGRAPVGQALQRDLRRNGRYVRLSRPLGSGALNWDARTTRGANTPGLDTRRWQASRVALTLGWLERLSGIRLPTGGPDAGTPTLEPGETALLLPAGSRGTGAGLLLAERDGQLFQYLPAPDGHWHLLESVTGLQVHPAVQVDGARLGLEPLPEVWSTLSSASRQERARRLRLLSLLLLLTLCVLVGRLLTHSGLWLLVGPALVLALLLAVSLERRFAPWVRHGAARGQSGPATELLFPPPAPATGVPVSGLRADGTPGSPPQGALPQNERLLSPQTRARLAALRTELERARTAFSPDPTLTLSSDLADLLEDRFSYPHPDPSLDALLEGQLAALQARLDDRLGLERQRARDLAAERLRREPVDPHF